MPTEALQETLGTNHQSQEGTMETVARLAVNLMTLQVRVTRVIISTSPKSAVAGNV